LQSEPITVLVVEDYSAVRRLIRDVLREAGYDVVAVRSCRQARLLLAHRAFALVIADILLPDGRGDALVETAADIGGLVMTRGPASRVSTTVGSPVTSRVAQ
jgi:CheY-like chemotaxis protein